MPEHGRYSTYNNWRCRCEPCTTAHRAHAQYVRAAQARAAEQRRNAAHAAWVVKARTIRERMTGARP